MYLKMPQEVQSGMQGIKPWIKTDLDSFYEQQYGVGFSEMQASNPTDPTQQLGSFEGRRLGRGSWPREG